MAHTKYLKIMVDEDLLDPDIVDALKGIGVLHVKTLFECKLAQGTNDKAVVAKAKAKQRLLLTANYVDINERRFPPCTHGGIILIDHKQPTAKIVRERIKAFCASGRKSSAKGHVTYLKDGKFVIHKLHREKIEERY